MYKDCTVVITTINEPTAALNSWLNKFSCVVVPDKKTPVATHNKSYLLDINEDFGISEIPFNHYARKNLGYIFASKSGVSFIMDTDDDTYYDESDFFLKLTQAKTIELSNTCGYINIFKLMIDQDINIWPRGYPLQAIQNKEEISYNEIDFESPSIIQFLINGDTDVDAISRLVFGVRDINFRINNTLYKIARNNFTPFNSQLTLYSRHVFPLLYLPSTVSFRFTDILRSVVAKKIIDKFNLSMCFFDTIGYQIRNEHDFMQDFESEIPCYTSIPKILELLDGIQGSDISSSIHSAYTLLNEHSYVDEVEIVILEKFLAKIH